MALKKGKNIPLCGTCHGDLQIEYSADGQAIIVACPKCDKILYDKEKFKASRNIKNNKG